MTVAVYSKSDLDAFLSAYIECAIWSSIDDRDGEQEPLDENHGTSDLAPETFSRIQADCRKFIGAHWQDIQNDLPQAGHDFWLTRNGHGAGFWDGDWPDDIGERLTKASKEFGECYLYVGDDGKIYQERG